MKDAYSFDFDQKGLQKMYDLMHGAYTKIFQRCGVDAIILEADSGAMGGDVSHEFMVPAPIGEDTIVSCPSCEYQGGATEERQEGSTCPKCKKGKLTAQVAIELGHIFQLGTKYSIALKAQYLDENGKQKPIIRGCYGIGVSRVIAAIIETNNDEKGIIWPREVAPFDIEILSIQGGDGNAGINKLADQYCTELTGQGFDILVDDRDESAGRKFNDADLIGIPIRIIIGKRNLADGKVEIKFRESGEVVLVAKDQAVQKIQEICESACTVN